MPLGGKRIVLFVAFRGEEVFRYLLPMCLLEMRDLVMCGLVVSQVARVFESN